MRRAAWVAQAWLSNEMTGWRRVVDELQIVIDE